MILAFDTYYFDNKAKSVCIAFDSWAAEQNFTIYSAILENIEDYVPGAFYRRELPCILSLLQRIIPAHTDAIIIDGFVVLDDDGKLGLGGYLFEQLNREIPVIGVAKTNFATLHKNKREVFRGKSLRPLYITSMGIDLAQASVFIQNMHGEHRIPTLLKKLDTLTKEINSN